MKNCSEKTKKILKHLRKSFNNQNCCSQSMLKLQMPRKRDLLQHHEFIHEYPQDEAQNRAET